MRREKSEKLIAEMSPSDRYEAAKSKLCNIENRGVVPALLNHLQLHENSRWLNYSRKLSEQVPTSHAAHAFGSIQSSTIHYEYIRLCTFWDPIDLDSYSIPTIVALADSTGVSRCVYEDHFKQYVHFDKELAKTWSLRARKRLREGIRLAHSIEKSEMLQSARNFRDKLAHQLEETRAEKSRPIAPPKYGHERILIKKTITAVNKLYVSLNGISFDWDNARKMHKRNADSFWEGVKIDVRR